MSSSSAVSVPATQPSVLDTKPARVSFPAPNRDNTSLNDATGNIAAALREPQQSAPASAAPDLGPAPFPSTVGPYPLAAVLPAPPPAADQNATASQHAVDDYKPPRAVTEIMPAFAADDGSALAETDIHVQLSIDDKGRVTAAQLLSPAGSKAPGVALDSLAAAKRWTFTPATMNGKPVSSTATVTFHLKPYN